MIDERPRPCIYYKEGYKYQLTRDYFVQTNICPPVDIITPYVHLSKTGLLRLLRGYAWDGASGPTVDTDSSMRGSAGHDGFYQLFRLGLLDISWRKDVDKLLKKHCIEDGMWVIRAEIWEDMVRTFARSAALPENERKELRAPCSI